MKVLITEYTFKLWKLKGTFLHSGQRCHPRLGFFLHIFWASMGSLTVLAAAPATMSSESGATNQLCNTSKLGFESSSSNSSSYNWVWRHCKLRPLKTYALMTRLFLNQSICNSGPFREALAASCTSWASQSKDHLGGGFQLPNGCTALLEETWTSGRLQRLKRTNIMMLRYVQELDVEAPLTTVTSSQILF